MYRELLHEFEELCKSASEDELETYAQQLLLELEKTAFAQMLMNQQLSTTLQPLNLGLEGLQYATGAKKGGEIAFDALVPAGAQIRNAAQTLPSTYKQKVELPRPAGSNKYTGVRQ